MSKHSGLFYTIMHMIHILLAYIMNPQNVKQIWWGHMNSHAVSASFLWLIPMSQFILSVCIH